MPGSRQQNHNVHARLLGHCGGSDRVNCALLPGADQSALAVAATSGTAFCHQEKFELLLVPAVGGHSSSELSYSEREQGATVVSHSWCEKPVSLVLSCAGECG